MELTPAQLANPHYTVRHAYIFKHGKGSTCPRKAWRMMLTEHEYCTGGGPRLVYAQPCPDCGRYREGRRVSGRFAPDIKCTAKCQAATGHDCDCSCAGKNHGARHAA